jgi:hypothetical protein
LTGAGRGLQFEAMLDLAHASTRYPQRAVEVAIAAEVSGKK